MKNALSIIIISFIMLTLKSGVWANNVKKEIVVKDAAIAEILNKADVYPNPAEDHIFLKISDSESISNIKIEVMSIIGTKMKVTHEKIESGLFKIDLSNIPTGHYYLLLSVDSEKSLKKFIKK